MALIKCSECGQMVSDKAPVCPHCGASINASGLNEMTNGFGGTESEGSNVNNNKTWIVLAVIGCVSIVLCIAAWLLFSSEQRQLEYEKQMMEIQRQDSVAQVELQERMRQDSIKQENEKVERMKKIVAQIWDDDKYLSPEFQKLIQEDNNLLSPDMPICCIDYDLWTHSQEGVEDIKIAQISDLTENSAKAIVEYKHYGNSETCSAILFLVRINAQWRVDEIVHDGYYEKKQLATCIEETKKQNY
ncbi:MAG: DUF3828 domain-containing protein [Muribaculaceae bacterium]|nr:DUF3828 domain-containing protein [Muribaculaceae bacterium]